MKFASKLAALALLAPSLASAGVIYEWRSANLEAPYGISLRMEFDEQAVRAGSLVFDVEQDYMAAPRPDSGLLSFSYSFPGAHDAITYRPREEGFAYGWGMMNLDLIFGGDGSLSGYIHANNSSSHFVMQSQGGLFTVLDSNSDMGMPGAGCEWGMSCNGATGYIRQATQLAPLVQIQEVPEPASIALIGAGLIGVLAGRRRIVRGQA